MDFWVLKNKLLRKYVWCFFGIVSESRGSIMLPALSLASHSITGITWECLSFSVNCVAFKGWSSKKFESAYLSRIYFPMFVNWNSQYMKTLCPVWLLILLLHHTLVNWNWHFTIFHDCSPDFVIFKLYNMYCYQYCWPIKDNIFPYNMLYLWWSVIANIGQIS